MSAESWAPSIGEFPYPPVNVEVVSPMFIGALDIRWDDPSTLNTGPNCPLTAACADLIVFGSVTNKPSVLVQASGTLTVTAAPLAAGESISLNGYDLTAVAGFRTSGQSDFNGSLGSPALIAAELADAINDAANPFSMFFTATAAGSTVVLEAVPDYLGTAGNDLTLASSSSSITLSGTTLTGGVDADTITIGGVTVLTAVTGARTSGENDFSIDGTTFDVAASIAAAINDVGNIFSGLVTAIADQNKVTLVAVTAGVAGNGVTLATTNTTLLQFSHATLVGGSGVAGCEGKSNTRWSIVGVNVYRSDTGERGPYHRLNDIPISNRFYRDQTDNIKIDEVVDWNSQWLSKGNSPNDPSWIFCTNFRPIVKQSGQAVHANQPQDVIVTIDGVQVPVHGVFGPTGQITLINVPSFDLATEQTIQPVLPKADGSSVVTVTYYTNRNLVKTDLDQNSKVFYRVTTVAVDPNGTSPSGLVETPLGWAPPKNVHEVESMDYIWREAIRRNTWILQQGGERVKLFQKRVTGILCPCRRREPGELFEMPYAQGLNEPGDPDARCRTCFGTGFVSGYEGPIDIILAPDDAERRVSQGANGRRLEHAYEVWTGPSPWVTQRDFIVKQTGERYSIGPVRRPASRGRPLQQHFNIAYIDEQDIRYQIPVTGITELAWPQTRTTDQRTDCNDGDPHPVGFDYQATTMQTEKDNIPDEREQRGRTPVWENITY